jgi:hypothetical protein
VFGAHNVRFHSIVAMTDIKKGEQMVLADLRGWRVRHTNGRLHEWLVGIMPCQLQEIVLRALGRAEMGFERIGSVDDIDP